MSWACGSCGGRRERWSLRRRGPRVPRRLLVARPAACAPDISWARPLGETLRLSVLPPRQEVRMSVTARTRLSRKICGGSGRGVAEFSHCTFCQASPRRTCMATWASDSCGGAREQQSIVCAQSRGLRQLLGQLLLAQEPPVSRHVARVQLLEPATHAEDVMMNGSAPVSVCAVRGSSFGFTSSVATPSGPSHYTAVGRRGLSFSVRLMRRMS